MTEPVELPVLLVWIAVLLSVLSLVAVGLQRRLASGGLNPVVEDLAARVRGWWIMAALLGLIYLTGRGGVVLLFAVCSMGALREFLTLTTRTKADHWAFVASFFLVLPLQYWSIWQGWYGFYTVFVPVYAFLLLPVLSLLRGRMDKFLTRVAETQWALMISVFCMSHIPALLFLDIPGFAGGNLLLMVFLVLVVQGADLAQHFWSACLGRHPMVPAMSRARSWEGFAGGLATAAAIGAGLHWLTPFGVVAAAGMAATIAAVGGMGRLVMSAIKRDRGVEDWGHMNDGQGGFIDRLDSIIFAAPVFFHLTRYFWQTLA
jgi:phosphatidate cytidylyltransferase